VGSGGPPKRRGNSEETFQQKDERRVLSVMVDARSAATVIERCDLLAGISEEPGLNFRPYGSQAMREANDLVAGWMRAAGMSVRSDPIGNLIGRYERTEDMIFVLGSHLDTVRDAGRYDGILGMMAALACVKASAPTGQSSAVRGRGGWLRRRERRTLRYDLTRQLRVRGRLRYGTPELQGP
jgi:hypothetical protein